MQEKICPYPGLRPFNEEESIFFRGREEHIDKIIGQLEEKKFVMLTGASGDGKSSLVYAGVLPNARAGFFKAKFNNWLIADFRPERTPLKNLSSALASKLNQDEKTVEQELNFGFSSLINLYKKSDYYLDSNSDNYKKADEADKKKLKRKAANLFVLVDQFEEFFTNPENYKNGQASNESQLVVNLLLETARIALAEDLPIYIVCTMRSDYIGQCAAFRGLPEYIGYSQFFVPRLKRKEIHQVINEPALLSGNSISNRLVETLINEIGDGFDQLPVLQHALNRIWNKTNKGQYEMDLLHLAMVGGLAPSQLPENDRAIFDGWFASVAENKKLFFKKPSLDAVLNAHAQELYETAHEYYNEQHSEKIEKREAQLIIKTAFQCLTKIDESRAVRNRMNLQEITDIVNDSSITVEKVDGVLRIFRLQGNTFLKPFANSDIENESLSPETVLDITHESLIRNWELLEQWAKEEHENWLTFQDFSKQLQRWTSNDKARGFLLPIGPLSFFENWYNRCKPNKYWLSRYDESNASAADKLKKAEATLESASEFINRSARNLFFSRTVLKYGAGKIIAVAGILLLLFACTYYYLDFKKKQNVAVLERINTRAIDLLGSPDVSVSYKADFLINTERLNEAKGNNSYTTFENLLNGINNDSMAFDIAYSMLNQCKTIQGDDSLAYDKQGILSMKVFTYLFHRFENNANTQVLDLGKKKNVSIKLERINKFLGLCALMKNSYTPRDSAAVETLCSKAIWLAKDLLRSFLQELQHKHIEISIPHFNYCLSLLLSVDDKPDYAELINFVAPITVYNLANTENSDTSKPEIKTIYSSWEKNYSLSCIDLPAEGQLEIASILYSTLYDKDTSLMKRIRRQNIFFENEKNYKPINIYFSLLRHSKAPIKTFDQILNSITSNKPEEKADFLNKLTSSFFETLSNTKQHLTPHQYLVKYFFSNERKDEIWDYLIQLYESNKLQTDSIKLCLAQCYKMRGVYCYDIKHDINAGNICFDKTFLLYKSISNEYLNNKHHFDFDYVTVPNYRLILYPKILANNIIPAYDCNSYRFVRDGEFFPLSISFWNYILNHNQISHYTNSNGVNTLFSYLEESDFSMDKSYFQMFRICKDNMNSLNYDKRNSFDYRGQVLFKIDTCLLVNDTLKAMEHFHAFISVLPKEFEAKGVVLTWLKKATKQMAYHGYTNESLQLLNLIKDETERRDVLLEICNTLQTEGPIENTFIYLDKLLEGATRETGAGRGLFRVLGKIGGKEINAIAQTKLRKTPELLKPKALQNLIKGVAERGSYYEALQYMPEYISESKELSLYNEILKAEILKRENKTAKNAYKGNWNDALFFELDLGTKTGRDLQFDSLD